MPAPPPTTRERERQPSAALVASWRAVIAQADREIAAATSDSRRGFVIFFFLGRLFALDTFQRRRECMSGNRLAINARAAWDSRGERRTVLDEDFAFEGDLRALRANQEHEISRGKEVMRTRRAQTRGR